MSQPLAFLSYTRKDDEFFGGYITAFRTVLETAVHVVTGQETFRIFQDVEGIIIGENWKKKLADVIDEASFLVPMMSPLFFSSSPCREEVTEFLAHERALERDDLILPGYFLSSAKLDKSEKMNRDPIAKELATRQIYDWRDNADMPLDEPAARRAVIDLARGIASALDRLTQLSTPSLDEVPGRGPLTERSEEPPVAGRSVQRAPDAPELAALDELLSTRDHGKVKREQLSPPANPLGRRPAREQQV